MAVRALHVGLGHQRRHLAGIGLRQALADQRSLNKISKRLETQDCGIGMGVQDDKPSETAGDQSIELVGNIRVNRVEKAKCLL
jgi:hypothetical protein